MPPIPGGPEIEKEVAGVIQGIVNDLGGPEAVTAAQRVILAGLRLSLLVQALSESYIQATGIVDRRTKKANSLLTIAATYVNSARLGATALGLERIPRNVTKSLEQTMLEIAQREQGEAESESETSTDENIDKT